MKKLLIIVVLVVLGTFSCNKPDNNCDEEKLTAAFVADHPDTVAINEVFNIDVNYIVENSCGNQGAFEGEKDGNSLEVKLKVAYSGCNCDNEFEEKTLNYPISFDESGTYELKFWVAENTYETYLIYVEE